MTIKQLSKHFFPACKVKLRIAGGEHNGELIEVGMAGDYQTSNDDFVNIEVKEWTLYLKWLEIWV